MILAVFVLASLLLAMAAFALVAAINLVPTDFGFTYAQIAAVLFGSGVLTLAIGLAGRALHREMRRVAVALEDNLQIAQTPSDIPPDIEVPRLREPTFSAMPEPLTGMDYPAGAESSALGTVAKAGAAALAAGALVAGAQSVADAQSLAGQNETPPETPDIGLHEVPVAVSDRIMEELESDLFAVQPAKDGPETHGAEAQTLEVRASETVFCQHCR